MKSRVRTKHRRQSVGERFSAPTTADILHIYTCSVYIQSERKFQSAAAVAPLAFRTCRDDLQSDLNALRWIYVLYIHVCL